jgi:MFS family permease
MTTTDLPTTVLPRQYLVWLSGVTVGRLGDAVLAFALGWAAAGHGGTTAALALTLNGLPRLVLLVLGGAVADRFGARRVLIGGETALLAMTAALALVLPRTGSPIVLLLAASLALGTVSAFCLPAAGSMPRRLVPDEQLSRALALRQSSGQIVLILAAPLGGVLVGTVGLPAIAWGDVVGLGALLAVLVVVRELPGPEPRGDDGPAPRLRGHDLADGLRVVARTPGLAGALVLTGAGAALMLPVPSLLVPLAGRGAGWGPGWTGATAGAVGAGVIVAALVTTRRRSATSRPGPGSGAAGLLVSAAGTGALAAGQLLDGAAAATVAVLGALTFGLGSGAFVARLAPRVLGSAPRTHLARVQALVGLAQLVPVLVTNTVLGAVAERTHPGWALSATAAALVATAAGARRWSTGTTRTSEDVGRPVGPGATVPSGERGAA